jgi:threonine dehydratase
VPCSVLVMDTAPRTKVEAITRLGATIVMASYDECWRTVETRRSDRMHGYFVHPFDDDRFIAGNGTIVAVASGGNIDLARFAQVVGACPPRIDM